MQRRPITLQEAKFIAPQNTVVMPHGSAGMFVVLGNSSLTETRDAVVRELKSQALSCGFTLEILHVGAGPSTSCLVQIRVTFNPQQARPVQVNADEQINVEQVKVAGVVVSHPANLKLAAKPMRIVTLRHFIRFGNAFASAKDLSPAFVNRLFVEGMIERDPSARNYFRPTIGGQKWFSHHAQ